MLLLTYVAVTGVFANYNVVNDHFNMDNLILKHHIYCHNLKHYALQNVSPCGKDYNLKVNFILSHGLFAIAQLAPLLSAET